MSEILKAIQKRLDPGFDIKNIVDQLQIIPTHSFTIVIQDSKEKHHGNCRVWVLNKNNQVIDDRLYYNIPTKMTHGKSQIIDSKKRTLE